MAVDEEDDDSVERRRGGGGALGARRGGRHGALHDGVDEGERLRRGGGDDDADPRAQQRADVGAMREHGREKRLDGELKGGRRGAVGGGEAEGLRRACGDPRE